MSAPHPRARVDESSSRAVARPRAGAAPSRRRVAVTVVALLLLALGAVIGARFWPVGWPRRYVLGLVGAAVLVVLACGLRRSGLAALRRSTLGRLPLWLRTTIVCGAVAALALRLARWPDVRGVSFVTHLGIALTALAIWCGATFATLRRRDERGVRLVAGAAGVAAGLIALAAIVSEGVLALLARASAPKEISTAPAADASTSGIHSSLPDASRRWRELHEHAPIDERLFAAALARHDHAVMPDAWRTQVIERPGARLAQRWHGVVHAEDHEGVRIPNDASTPARPVGGRAAEPNAASRTGADRARPAILVMGDSFTYGLGIDTPDRFTERLEELLGRGGVEARVINRGVCSDQSEDVARRFAGDLDRFEPVVAVYAICLNDFLPSGVDIYDRSWTLPAWLDERSRLLRAIDGGLVQAQIALGLSADFHSDILRNLGDCRDRFDRDLRSMADRAAERGVPLLAIVLDPIPAVDGSGAEIAAAAEEACWRAGIEVVDTSDVRVRFAGVPLMVSPWEPHANEIAHAAWAKILADRIRPLIARAPTDPLPQAPPAAAPPSTAPPAAAPPAGSAGAP